MAQGAPIGNTNNGKSQTGHFDQFESPREVKDGTAGRIGKQYGVGEKTVRRDADFAKGLDADDEVSPGIKDAVLKGEVKAPKETLPKCGNQHAKVVSGQNDQLPEYKG